MTRAGWMIAAVTITAITVIARHISVGDAGVTYMDRNER
ncbi:hypothetical protein EDF22_0621 [Rathayibacter sp. PhB127]|nr:hypothetical protein EDF22_0621 [Rathayibacter sp. PhB127]